MRAPSFERKGPHASAARFSEPLEFAVKLRARGAQELAAVVHALDPEKTCEAMVYGSLFHNAVYHACVEQYADRPLTRVDDVLAAVAASLHG